MRMAKPPKAKGRPRPKEAKSGNERLAAQNRKLLGKHYAAKYGKRRG